MQINNKKLKNANKMQQFRAYYYKNGIKNYYCPLNIMIVIKR